MTEEEAVIELLRMSVHDADSEVTHERADAILLLFLEEKGFNKIAKTYLGCKATVGFWYS